ncbi:MAG: Fe-S cluster assembly protein SufD [Verrucomicrobia bacterium]|nr:Fe-S cluster assembly protein SufD [Verrucomicrobiota bacterium]
MLQTLTKPGTRKADPFVAGFARLEQDPRLAGPPWLLALRRAALARFAEHGFPTPQQEDWRFTNVAPLAKLPFRPLLEAVDDGGAAAALERFAFARQAAARLVFLNGHFAPRLSSLGTPPTGVRLGSLAAALNAADGTIQRHLAAQVRGDTDAFAALNSAYFQDGAFVFVPADTTLETPVHLLFLCTAGEPGAAIHPRNLIVAEPGSRFTVIEHYVGAAQAAYVTNAVTELVAGAGARLEHCKFQEESPTAFHLARLHAHLGRECKVLSHSFALGARLSRYNLNAVLAAPGVECVLNGLYLARGEELADHHMIVEHAQPHCASHEYFNGILADHARGVFHGRILVRPEAQKTDAKQTNRNLLLSDSATIDTKPQLEIYADDVKCTHGATVGQLNDEAIFYLRARGVGRETARRMLIHAFAGEIIERVRCEPVRQELDGLIWERLEQHPRLTEHV